MDIETKFSIGDVAWHMHENKPQKVIIKAITINVTGSGNADKGDTTSFVKVNYTVHTAENPKKRTNLGLGESALYATAVDLMHQLFPMVQSIR